MVILKTSLPKPLPVVTKLTDEPSPGHWHLLDGREGRLGDDLQGGAHCGAEGAQEEARHLGQPGTHFPRKS